MSQVNASQFPQRRIGQAHCGFQSFDSIILKNPKELTFIEVHIKNRIKYQSLNINYR